MFNGFNLIRVYGHLRRTVQTRFRPRCVDLRDPDLGDGRRGRRKGTYGHVVPSTGTQGTPVGLQ